MDAVVLSDRSARGRKYAYTFVDMGPTTYQEGFTLVKRSDLYDAFFPMILKLRSRFQRHHNYPLCAELLVDCAGEHVSAEFGKRCEAHDIHLQFPSTRKENMGLAEVIMKHTELGMKTQMLEVVED